MRKPKKGDRWLGHSDKEKTLPSPVFNDLPRHEFQFQEAFMFMVRESSFSSHCLKFSTSLLIVCFFCLSGFANATTYEMQYYSDGADHFYSPPIYLDGCGTHTFYVNGVPFAFGGYNYVAFKDSGSGYYTQIWSDSTIAGIDPSFSTYVCPGYKVKLVIRAGTTIGSGTVESVYYWYIYQTPETITTPSTPSGPSSGETGQSLSFSTSASSNLSHSLQYRFDWGDGAISSWGSPTQTHSYSNSGTFPIRAQARCATHTSIISSWSNPRVVNIAEMSLPDLIVEDISLTPTQVNSGTSSTFQRTVQVRNIGDAPSGSCQLRIQTSGAISGTETVSIPPLSPGQLHNDLDQFSYTFSSPGNYSVTILATVDYYGDIAESNEGNNTRQETFIINVVELLPDLIVEDIGLSPLTIYAGDSLQRIIRIRNNGDVSSGPCDIELATNINNAWCEDHETIGCPSLSPGQSHTRSDMVNYNLSCSPLVIGENTVRIRAEVDHSNNVSESNENNNIREETFNINVLSPQLDLLAPNGGEELVVDSNSIVEWDTYGTIPTVNLDVSIDGGENWESLESTLPNTGQYEWSVTEYWASPDCLLRVSNASDATIYDESEDIFQIFVCTLNYDLDDNCFVDLADIALLATEWLQSGNPYK